ncbi:hypothetical protein M514_08208 [Trichuris suis]|uniref:Uncharacterized protein n=1 Tax=Trichuris suis TaxID=68888 RepID=A0A085M0Z9_9BILA|nr:hypothetical protein M513_08208 [Trichuris suis]KFD65344.1 hypothetical protein M514_08208 [Trichuris suis]
MQTYGYEFTFDPCIITDGCIGVHLLAILGHLGVTYVRKLSGRMVAPNNYVLYVGHGDATAVRYLTDSTEQTLRQSLQKLPWTMRDYGPIWSSQRYFVLVSLEPHIFHK